jgi:hypothetical protein
LEVEHLEAMRLEIALLDSVDLVEIRRAGNDSPSPPLAVPR